MSHKASSWLAEIPARAINAGAFRVLFHLCDAHNSKRPPETACFPSQELLREAAGLSNGGLNNALNAIEHAGLMRRRRTRNADGTKGPTYYILGCDEVIAPTPTPENGDGTNSNFGAEPSPNSGPNHLHSTGDKPVIEPVIEPVSARERADDLFSALEETEGPNNDEITNGFNTLWNEIWPSHTRKTGKADCLKVYRAACTGKHSKAEERITPEILNACAASYVASVRDMQFLKGLLPWLRQPGWEPFLAAQTGRDFIETDLTERQDTMLSEGRVPPSMMKHGRPNPTARYWLKQYGFGERLS